MLKFGVVVGLVTLGVVILVLCIVFLIVYLWCYNKSCFRHHDDGFYSTRHFSGFIKSADKHSHNGHKPIIYAYESDVESTKDPNALYAQVTLPKIRRSKIEENLASTPKTVIKLNDDVELETDEDGKRPTSVIVDNGYENQNCDQQILSVHDFLRKNQSSGVRSSDNFEEDDLSQYSECYPEDRYSTRETDVSSSMKSSRRTTPDSNFSRQSTERQVTVV